jgi:hypothetical protein
MLFAAVHEPGTFETSRGVGSSVAIGGRTDIARTSHFGSEDPQRTYDPSLRSGGQEFESPRARHFATIRNKTTNSDESPSRAQPACLLLVERTNNNTCCEGPS